MRTFLAIDLDDDIRMGLLEAMRQLDAPGQRINWVAEHQLHVTMKFLGDVPDSAIQDVCDAMADSAGAVEAFDFCVRGVTAVPPRGELRMLWADVDDSTGLMNALHDELDNRLSGISPHDEDRKFSPHVTLARIKFAKNPLALRKAVEPWARHEFGTQRCAEIVAYASQLTADGPIYTPVARGALR